MKKIIGFLGAHLFYYLGDWTSIVMEKFDWDSLYPMYKAFMNWSLNIQYWADISKPWSEPPQKQYEDE